VRTHIGRTARCYHGPFGGEAVAAVAFGDASRLFAATSTDVYELDLRAPGVVLREARAKLAGLAADDINQLSVQHHPRTGALKYLAVADDSGRVTLLDASASGVAPRPYRTLARRGGSGEEGMCTCVGFRPRAQWDLACGFLQQCTLGLWDFGRARCRALDVGAAVSGAGQEEEEEEEEEEYNEDDEDPTISPPPASSSQLFNPPYIHGLAFDAWGRHLAAALGNGEVVVYEYARANQPDNGGPPLARLRGGHASSVAGVCFLEAEEHGRGGDGAGPGEWLRLASAGNDRVLNLWECPAAPRGGRGAGGAGASSNAGSDRPKPRVARRIDGLPGKPNWVVSAPAEGGGIRIFVANTTPEIAVFHLRPTARQEKEGKEKEKGAEQGGGGRASEEA
jgi:hypothetical protein